MGFSKPLHPGSATISGDAELRSYVGVGGGDGLSEAVQRSSRIPPSFGGKAKVVEHSTVGDGVT